MCLLVSSHSWRIPSLQVTDRWGSTPPATNSTSFSSTLRQERSAIKATEVHELHSAVPAHFHTRTSGVSVPIHTSINIGANGFPALPIRASVSAGAPSGGASTSELWEGSSGNCNADTRKRTCKPESQPEHSRCLFICSWHAFPNAELGKQSKVERSTKKSTMQMPDDQDEHALCLSFFKETDPRLKASGYALWDFCVKYSRPARLGIYERWRHHNENEGMQLSKPQ